MEVLSRLMTRSLGETYQTKRESVRYVTDDDLGWGVNLSFRVFLVKRLPLVSVGFSYIKPLLQLLLYSACLCCYSVICLCVLCYIRCSRILNL